MNINAMMKQAKKLQEEMEEKQKELNKMEFTVEKQGIKLVMTGDKKVKSLTVNEALIDPEDKDILEGLIMIAFNEAIDKIDEKEDELMPKTTPGALPF